MNHNKRSPSDGAFAIGIRCPGMGLGIGAKMISAVLILLFMAALVTVFVKVKNDRTLDIAESDLDDDMDPELVDAALAPKAENWDAAQ